MENNTQDFGVIPEDKGFIRDPASQNFGVILGDHRDTYAADRVKGALPYTIEKLDGNWEEDLPTPEVQFGFNGDKMNCVTQSYNNVIETQFEKLRKEGKIPQATINFLQKYGFFDEFGRLNLNDRIAAILNGTTREGNWLWKVADTARITGCFPESVLTSDENVTWDEYYDRSKITQEILNIGLEFLKHFQLPYESVSIDRSSMLKHMKQAPLQVVIPGHAVEDFFTTEVIINFFDTYEPFKKQVSSVIQAMKILLLPIAQAIPPEYLLVDIKLGDTGRQVEKLLSALSGAGWRLKVPQTQTFVYDLKVAELVKNFSFANVHTFMSWDYLWEKYYYKGSVVGPNHRYVINKLIK